MTYVSTTHNTVHQFHLSLWHKVLDCPHPVERVEQAAHTISLQAANSRWGKNVIMYMFMILLMSLA